MPHRYQLPGLLVLLCSTLPALAQEPLPAGRLAFESTSCGLLIGYNWGKGTLSFQGREYPFSIEGYKLFTVGVASVDALGVVYDLDKLSDFEGRYTAAEGSLTLWQGGGGAVMENQNGVVIYLQTLQQGLELSLGGSIDIVLEQPPAEPAAGGEAQARPAAATEGAKAKPVPTRPMTGEQPKVNPGNAGAAGANQTLTKPAADERSNSERWSY